MSARDDAKHTLVYYFRLILQRTGQNWSADMQAEVEGIVDDIIQAAIEP